jgi:TonB family protein
MAASQEPYTPARFSGGPIPALPVQVVGSGQVLLELDVTAEGRVATVKALRGTPPFTDVVLTAVRDWRFQPAQERQQDPSQPSGPPKSTAIASKVLVAAMFRAPTLLVPTLGEVPRDVATPSPELAFPVGVSEPPHPPSAIDPGVVLIEARLERSGRVTETAVIRSKPPYDAAALSVVRNWTFRPARVNGAPAPTLVYILFGFPVPVV